MNTITLEYNRDYLHDHIHEYINPVSTMNVTILEYPGVTYYVVTTLTSVLITAILFFIINN